MPAEELNSVLWNHVLWLADPDSGERADFSGADLSGENFSQANLSRAIFTGADLSDANFTWANLSGAVLTGANLKGANLAGAFLAGADLANAEFDIAVLALADFGESGETRSNAEGKASPEVESNPASLKSAGWDWGEVWPRLLRTTPAGGPVTSPLKWDDLKWDTWVAGTKSTGSVPEIPDGAVEKKDSDTVTWGPSPGVQESGVLVWDTWEAPAPPEPGPEPEITVEEEEAGEAGAVENDSDLMVSPEEVEEVEVESERSVPIPAMEETSPEPVLDVEVSATPEPDAGAKEEGEEEGAAPPPPPAPAPAPAQAAPAPVLIPVPKKETGAVFLRAPSASESMSPAPGTGRNGTHESDSSKRRRSALSGIGSKISGLFKKKKEVAVSSFVPRAIRRDEPFTLQCWIHWQTDKAEVKKRAESSGHARQAGSREGMVIAEGALVELSITPRALLDANGGREPQFRTIRWEGFPANADFGLIWPTSAPASVIETVEISVEGLPLGECLLKLRADQEPAELIASDFKRIRRAFVSYSRYDTERVLASIQAFQTITNVDLFLDVDSLRAGDDWQDRLKTELTSRDAFFLYWSESAAQSVWVEREWMTAFRERGLAYIKPMPLDPVEAPEELAELQFSDKWARLAEYYRLKEASA